MLTCVEFQNKSISWLLHGVEMNMSDQDRVCISFNIGMVPVNK